MSTPAQTQPRIFVSHAHEDNALCRAFVQALRLAGAEVWYDEHNLGYGDFAAAIERELLARPIFIPILSPASAVSRWVRRETEAAIHLQGREPERIILPVVAAKADVPLLWVGYKRLAGSGDAGLSPEEAARRVLNTLAQRPAAEAPPDGGQRRAGGAADDVTSSSSGPVLAPRMAALGFEARILDGVEVIVPPLCEVPAGEFLMGSNPQHDAEAQVREQPQQTVHLAAYLIGRFPVTVAEYACFVRTGRREPEDWQYQLARLDYPVVNVSWHDAMAYAAWLARVTGQPWRLPTEAEWEKAARWDPAARYARIYPWGDRFDRSRCNTRESGIGRTTPVGKYPTGASPCGSQDMAGNVLEWTSSVYKPYPYTADAGRENPASAGRRVLRGGSWGVFPQGARAAVRYDGIPSNIISNYYGFRLVDASLDPTRGH
jgi:formylglycine-generating enzyme required for sulfatase activity